MSELKLCTAAQEKIGKRAGVERETVNRNIPTMIEKGLIRESGFTQGTTKSYACLVDISSIFEMHVTQNHPTCDNESQGDVTINHTKKDIKETSKDIKQNYADALERGVKLSNTIQMDFQNHLGLSPNWDTKTNQAHYQFFRERYEAGQTAKDFADWWRDDWKGEGGSLPASINQVQSLWFQAFVKSDPLQLSAIERGAKKVYE